MKNKDELIEMYKQRYGEGAPIPPDHLLERLATGQADEDFKKMNESQQVQINQLIDSILMKVRKPDGSYPEDLFNHNNPMWSDLDQSKPKEDDKSE